MARQRMSRQHMTTQIGQWQTRRVKTSWSQTRQEKARLREDWQGNARHDKARQCKPNENKARQDKTWQYKAWPDSAGTRRISHEYTRQDNTREARQYKIRTKTWARPDKSKATHEDEMRQNMTSHGKTMHDKTIYDKIGQDNIIKDEIKQIEAG